LLAAVFVELLMQGKIISVSTAWIISKSIEQFVGIKWTSYKSTKLALVEVHMLK